MARDLPTRGKLVRRGKTVIRMRPGEFERLEAIAKAKAAATPGPTSTEPIVSSSRIAHLTGSARQAAQLDRPPTSR
jgi:hypothetical protein